MQQNNKTLIKHLFHKLMYKIEYENKSFQYATFCYNVSYKAL